MSRINKQRLCGMLGFAMRAGRLVISTEQVCSAMAKTGRSRPRLVLIADGASDNTKKKLTVKGEFYKIDTITIPLDKETLGRLLGKSYDPVAIGVCDDAFAREIRAALGTVEETSRKEVSPEGETGDTDGSGND